MRNGLVILGAIGLTGVVLVLAGSVGASAHLDPRTNPSKHYAIIFWVAVPIFIALLGVFVGMLSRNSVIPVTALSVAPLIVIVCFAHGWGLRGFLWSALYLVIACGLSWAVSRRRLLGGISPA
jgi:fucose permease